ncbi:MAG: TIM-barrel domain-containing protein [Bacteroidales bacterium]
MADNDTGYTVEQRFLFSENEAIYGFGQHQNGTMNYRFDTVELVQHNMEAVVPFFISTNGYGILWDNYSYSRFAENDEYASLWSEMGDGIDYYFIAGDSADEVISGYRQLTGASPMMPKYALGYIQCKERYKTQDELISVVKKFRERQIPIDMIVQDWRYWELGHWGEKKFDSTHFPDPLALTKQLHEELNTHLMISVWPKMDSITEDYKELREHLYKSSGSQAVYDAFSEEARDIYWKQANEGFFSKGIDAWWCDATEPEVIGWDHSVETLKKFMKPAIGSSTRYLNAYSLMHSKGIYNNQRETTDEKRVVNLTRSAYGGQQAYSAITWSGDVMGDWDGFRDQITAGLNFCMSGIPYWTMDIGGFFVFPRSEWTPDRVDPKYIEDYAYRELYVRWFQWGAFCPVFRSHGTNLPREPWRFGKPGDTEYETIVDFIELRYRLMPYIYSLAWKVTNEDYTIMRGLVMDFPKDEKVYEITDQYMFGPAFLVCPVTEPGAKTREVYLPKHEAGWFNFWTGEHLEGDQTIIAPAPLMQMPLFVKGGSILPVGPVKQYTRSLRPEEITLVVFPGNDAEFTLYDDEGDNYNYEQGKYYTITIQYDDESGELSIDKAGDPEMIPAEIKMKISKQDLGYLKGYERGSEWVIP